MQTVLLYYKFFHVRDPHDLRDWQYDLCRKLKLKGRIIIAEEGINGTVAGDRSSCEEYMSKTEEKIGKLEWKTSHSEIEELFPKLKVKVRPEIVTFGVKVDLSKKAPYIDSYEMRNLYNSEEFDDYVIVDGRNEYESRIGRFKYAVTPDINNFREFPKWFKKNRGIFKGKKVVTYCTGGIRCEKLSAFLIEQGIRDVFQLHGGIHRYSERTGGENFEGEMYVFDARVHVPVNFVNPNIISRCHFCGKSVARFKNCKNQRCNSQEITCEECEKLYSGFCKKCTKNL
ncbi:rhodanese-related sulfurtransferase [Candidatus Dojkabacteria bacterium]|uniref:tRNA uridine(34) hydroxylase n=1 Tax=Candidatus Dojkabacteria bacterium TaxID=2099670 RepID=A0A3M0YZF3_9BACT|nr:MAG: rhodanese-related sulfurtransferase [Candidatus Dojkabacteria bacterium]